MPPKTVREILEKYALYQYYDHDPRSGGMSEEEALTALRNHLLSKLPKEKELYGHTGDTKIDVINQYLNVQRGGWNDCLAKVREVVEKVGF